MAQHSPVTQVLVEQIRRWSDVVRRPLGEIDILRLRNIAGHVAEDLQQSIARFSGTERVRAPVDLDRMWFGAGFGRRWPGHFLAGSRLMVNARFTEPQLTAELVGWLNATDSRVRARRIMALLDALGSDRVPVSLRRPNWSLSLHKEVDPTCLAHGRFERGTRRNGAIDIVIRARGPLGQLAYVLIEAKLEAGIGQGQLKKYEAFLPSGTRNLSRCIFLCVRAPAKLDIGWSLLRWRELLGRLDAQLCLDDDLDPDFQRFRAEAYWRTGG